MAVSGLQLLARSVELLRGDEWSGYLTFNLGTYKPSDYAALMNGTYPRQTARKSKANF